MPKIKPSKPLAKNEDYIRKEPDDQPELLLDNKLQLAKWQADVHNRLKKDIGADFVLAKLNEHQREVMTEIIMDAFLIKKQMTKIKVKSRHWKWDKKTKEWVETEYSKQKQKDMQSIIDKTFDSIMVRVYSSVVLHRNVDKNTILEYLAEYRRRDDSESETGTKLKDQALEIIQPEEEST